jgi:hypothetical protein
MITTFRLPEECVFTRAYQPQRLRPSLELTIPGMCNRYALLNAFPCIAAVRTSQVAGRPCNSNSLSSIYIARSKVVLRTSVHQ